jgi:hypothetical protein
VTSFSDSDYDRLLSAGAVPPNCPRKGVGTGSRNWKIRRGTIGAVPGVALCRGSRTSRRWPRLSPSSSTANPARPPRRVDGTADCRMLRLGLRASTFSRSWPRQLLWHQLRSSGAQSRYCPGLHAVQIASGQRDRRALGEIDQGRVPGSVVHFQSAPSGEGLGRSIGQRAPCAPRTRATTRTRQVLHVRVTPHPTVSACPPEIPILILRPHLHDRVRQRRRRGQDTPLFSTLSQRHETARRRLHVTVRPNIRRASNPNQSRADLPAVPRHFKSC